MSHLSLGLEKPKNVNTSVNKAFAKDSMSALMLIYCKRKWGIPNLAVEGEFRPKHRKSFRFKVF